MLVRIVSPAAICVETRRRRGCLSRLMRRRGALRFAVDDWALALARVVEVPVYGGAGHAEEVSNLLDRVVASVVKLLCKGGLGSGQPWYRKYRERLPGHDHRRQLHRFHRSYSLLQLRQWCDRGDGPIRHVPDGQYATGVLLPRLASMQRRGPYNFIAHVRPRHLGEVGARPAHRQSSDVRAGDGTLIRRRSHHRSVSRLGGAGWSWRWMGDGWSRDCRDIRPYSRQLSPQVPAPPAARSARCRIRRKLSAHEPHGSCRDHSLTTSALAPADTVSGPRCCTARNTGGRSLLSTGSSRDGSTPRRCRAGGRPDLPLPLMVERGFDCCEPGSMHRAPPAGLDGFRAAGRAAHDDSAGGHARPMLRCCRARRTMPSMPVAAPRNADTPRPFSGRPSGSSNAGTYAKPVRRGRVAVGVVRPRVRGVA